MGGNLATALYAASAGAAVLGMLSMARRWTQAFAYRAGLALFGLIAVLQAGNFIEASSVRLPVWSIQLIGALAATTLPVAWLYTRDLISDHPRPLMRADILHFIVPIAFAPHIVWAALGLGQAEEDALWGLTPMTDDARWFAGVGIVLTIAWVLQVSIYSVRIAYALLALPKRLRLVFADTKGRDLLWMRVIGLLIIAHLPFAILANLGLIDPPETTFAVFAFALTLGLAGATGVQTPVFQESPSEPKRTVAISAADIATEKYARSLLDEARLERIATRLESAFEQDKLHLDANLSLGKLSERLGV
ncbi:MAG: hypothetical protein KAG62_16225, partial [Caulobacter sp.]|nr:hypothetical protein [Caulobacter sp.]